MWLVLRDLGWVFSENVVLDASISHQLPTPYFTTLLVVSWCSVALYICQLHAAYCLLSMKLTKLQIAPFPKKKKRLQIVRLSSDEVMKKTDAYICIAFG